MQVFTAAMDAGADDIEDVDSEEGSSEPGFRVGQQLCITFAVVLLLIGNG